MSVMITDDCINCGACEIECAANAIFPKSKQSAEKSIFINNKFFAEAYVSYEHFYVSPNKCNMCAGYYNEPRCNSVCPVSCCVTEEDDSVFSNTMIKVKTNPILITKVSLN